MPFRKLFCVTLTIAALFSASQLILITRLNTKLGIPDFLFAVGDEVIVDTAGFIVQMPTLVMCASLCPKGVESTLYALMTVVNNIALSVGGSFSAALAESLGIQLENYENLWILTLITSASTLIPILLIPMVPDGVNECEENSDAVDEATGEANGEEEGSVPEVMRRRRRASSENIAPVIIAKSKKGGGAFLIVLLVGLLYSIINAGFKLFATDDVIITDGLGNITSIDGMNASNSTFQWKCELEALAEEERSDGEKDDRSGQQD